MHSNSDDLTPFITENYGPNVQRQYYCYFDKKNSYKIKHTAEENDVRWNSLSQFFRKVFLPHGYPDSVSEDYLQYQIWDSIQAFASSITGSIATHALLKGVGVGDETATTLAATVSWLTRDGISMVGRILFSWIKGTQLDSDCKKWRLFADVLNDVAMFLDLMSAHFKGYYMIIICISGLFKAIVGVAGGATRAALTQHQARRNNMADVSAKDGSQETLVNLAALICSLIIIPVVTQNSMLVWLLYVAMTSIHLLANYQAINSVNMNTFNMARFTACLNNYLESDMETVCNIVKANRSESLSFFPHWEVVKIYIGSSFHNATKKLRYDQIIKLVDFYKKWDYFMTSESYQESNNIKICLHHDATDLTQIKAMFHAFCLRQLMVFNVSKDRGHAYYRKSCLWEQYSKTDFDDNFGMHSLAKTLTESHFEDFRLKCKAAGWNMDIALFNADSWRLTWQ